jgi:predicted glycoside hydrolase/deacetylase ChbG (UPF0249 family)
MPVDGGGLRGTPPAGAGRRAELQQDGTMKIIINSDDLGASVRVNDCIFELMEQGRVTSATLMMNAPAVEDAVRRIGNYVECSFGVHLNLTEFSPLTTHPGLRSLLNGKGEFAGVDLRSPRNIPLNTAIREGVYAEWCAQIERALALGVPVSHIDSHHHVHTRFSLLPVLKRVQRKFGIQKVRIRKSAVRLSQPVRLPFRMQNSAWNFLLRRYSGATTTGAFMAFSAFYERLRMGCGWPGAIELMCHPGGQWFAAETELLRGDWRQELPLDAQLISYNELN